MLFTVTVVCANDLWLAFPNYIHARVLWFVIIDLTLFINCVPLILCSLLESVYLKGGEKNCV